MRSQAVLHGLAEVATGRECRNVLEQVESRERRVIVEKAPRCRLPGRFGNPPWEVGPDRSSRHLGDQGAPGVGTWLKGVATPIGRIGIARGHRQPGVLLTLGPSSSEL